MPAPKRYKTEPVATAMPTLDDLHPVMLVGDPPILTAADGRTITWLPPEALEEHASPSKGILTASWFVTREQYERLMEKADDSS